MKSRDRFLFNLGRAVLFIVLVYSPIILSSIQAVRAQQPPGSTPSTVIPVGTPPRTSLSSRADDLYRVGPGDVLEIRIFKRPEISREAVRVDARGMISMPLIEGEIQAACRTETEIAKEIADRYRKYLLNPQVDVFVKEYQSQPVAVIGAVMTPGRFQLQRRVRLLELLAFAGGPAERAGAIQIVHSGVSVCENPGSSNSAETATSQELALYKIKDTLRGEDGANPFILPGDIVTLPEADQIYVVGNVAKPSAIPLKEPMTVSRAIAAAGGVLRDSKTDRVRIVRQVAGSTTKTELYVNLKAIARDRAEDVMLGPNDIVEVPESSGKSFLRALVGAVVPSVTQIPVRVIP